MRYKPFKQQKDFFKSKARIRCLFAAKRSGKSEICYLDVIRQVHTRPGWTDNEVDPFLAVVIAPTDAMLRRLTWPKLLSFSKPFKPQFFKAEGRLEWPNGSIIYGISAEKIERMEGLKVNHIFMDEAFQMKEDVLYESLARLSDSQGSLVIAGSLGTNIANPKNHWLYQAFKEKKMGDSEVFQWSTAENPHFPQEELERLQNALDPRTYRQLFEIDWNVPGTNLVYDDFSEDNRVSHYTYDPNLETSVCIDWGWAHPTACLWFQYDKQKDTVYLFDEIVESRVTIDQLYDRVMAKPYKIHNWYCDIAGSQEREQTGRSNIRWFSDKGVIFKYRRTAVTFGIPLVRQYIRNGRGQTKFFIDETRCPKSIDGIMNYSYPEKDGSIQNENPIKRDDDACDAIRYFFVNRLDKEMTRDKIVEFNRWGAWQV